MDEKLQRLLKEEKDKEEIKIKNPTVAGELPRFECWWRPVCPQADG
jgi:hypothetical protein